MKIERTIDGRKYVFELTEQEVNAIYYAQDKVFVMTDINDAIESELDNKNITTEEANMIDKERVFELYEKFRSNSDDWTYNMKDAIYSALSEPINKN